MASGAAQAPSGSARRASRPTSAPAGSAARRSRLLTCRESHAPSVFAPRCEASTHTSARGSHRQLVWTLHNATELTIESTQEECPLSARLPRPELTEFNGELAGPQQGRIDNGPNITSGSSRAKLTLCCSFKPTHVRTFYISFPSGITGRRIATHAYLLRYLAQNRLNTVSRTHCLNNPASATATDHRRRCHPDERASPAPSIAHGRQRHCRPSDPTSRSLSRDPSASAVAATGPTRPICRRPAIRRSPRRGHRHRHETSRRSPGPHIEIAHNELINDYNKIDYKKQKL
ncbi:unnamed protein product [Trichogramma brassicae]|uniref:Uncharacterized protein n=1 Tax=Trichogramma brassicae TaxID=86971 RepID=A0A6H5INC7_9HYME|nr:unnamed protein product [Trichogramma brassicae]